jgi:hypothetical protein
MLCVCVCVCVCVASCWRWGPASRLRPDVATFARALAPFGLSLVSRVDAFPDFIDVSSAGAFLCKNTRSWFGVRRVGAHWINLNHAMQRPAQLVAEHLGVCLRQLEDDGYEIYAVIGELPPCAAASDPLFSTYFDWGLVGGLFLPSAAATDDEYDDEIDALSGNAQWDVERDEYERLLAETARESYQNDLQAAIAASLVARSSGGRLTPRSGRRGEDRPSSSSAPLGGAGTSSASPLSSRAMRRPREEIHEDDDRNVADAADEEDYGDEDAHENVDDDDDDGIAAAIAASLQETRPSHAPLVLKPSRAVDEVGASGSPPETGLVGALGDVKIMSPPCPLPPDAGARGLEAGVSAPSKLPWSRDIGCIGGPAPSPLLLDADASPVCSVGPSKLPVVGSGVANGSLRSNPKNRDR